MMRQRLKDLNTNGYSSRGAKEISVKYKTAGIVDKTDSPRNF